jgi:hypothetical protein
MSSMMPIGPRIAPQPLTADIKLKALNEIRVAQRLSPVTSIPTPQIILTPAVPNVGGQNYFTLHGVYCSRTAPPTMFVYGRETSIDFSFATVAGKSYLLDVNIGGGLGSQFWKYRLLQGGPFSLLKHISLQQGHLVIPFRATAATTTLGISPVGQASESQFCSAELTRVD